MRQELVHFLGKDVVVQGVLSCYGLKQKYRYSGAAITLLLKDLTIHEGDNFVYLDHVWTTCNEEIKTLNICEGSQIELNATIKYYKKGGNPRKSKHSKNPDIGLRHIHNIKVLEENKYGRTYKEFLYVTNTKCRFVAKQYCV